MDEREVINTDLILKDLGGCGLFQVILVLFTSIATFPTFFNLYFMTFGIHDPGWRCLDNVTLTTTTNWTETTSMEPVHYVLHSCEGFDSCQSVEFNPEAVTIATEWGLICGQSWIPSLIISIEMSGNWCAQLLVGYLGDRFGRKLPLHISLCFQCILNIISIFSVSWEMYAAISFLMGFTAAFTLLSVILSAEFVVPKWRIGVSSLPTWSFSAIALSVCAMLSKNWKTLRLINCSIAAVAFIAMFWVPESLRWLSLNGKEEGIVNVTRKIAKLNKTEMTKGDDIKLLVGHVMREQDKTVGYENSFFSLFRKGYRWTTCIIGFSFFTMDMIYFALSFGISALPGNIYENMIILTASELPANVISISVANRFGRKKSALVFLILESLCLFGVVALDGLATLDVKTIGTLVLVVVAKIFLNVSWYIIATALLEIYPTVVRSKMNSFAIQMSVMGGVFAPYLVPSDPSKIYICYIVMAGITLTCGLLMLLIPETKGKILKDTWGDSTKGNDISMEEKKNEVI